MADHIVENNPKKELLYALVGIVMFLGLVLLVGVSAFLRPAGNHVDVKALNAAQEAKAVASATPATAPVTAGTAAAASGDTTNTTTATSPDATVASPDSATQASADKPKDTADAGVTSPAAVADRKEKTADAKEDIKENTGKTPAIDPPVTESDSKTGEAKVTSPVPAAQEKAGSTETGQATK